MTWEWVALASVCVLCGTIFSVLKLSLRPKVGENATSLLDVQKRLSQVEAFVEYASPELANIHKLAEDTKKLLSEANLVKGFRPQR